MRRRAFKVAQNNDAPYLLARDETVFGDTPLGWGTHQ